MATYTLSENYIKGIKNNDSHLHNVLLKFSNPDCPHKVSMDKSKKLLQIYMIQSKNNVDIQTWLDWMTRTAETKFEIIDVNLDKITCDEELYLKVASSTNRDKKIVVATHQFWKKFQYIDGCSKIRYNNFDIDILDRVEVINDLNPPQTNYTVINNNMIPKNNPWSSGLFYLFLAIIPLVTISTIAQFIDWYILPIVIIGAILIIGIVGAFQLKNDDKLSEKSFVELMKATYKSLPLLKSIGNDKNNNKSE